MEVSRLTEKDILGWALASQKQMAHAYLATVEHTDNLAFMRELFSIMQEEHEMRMQIYQMMHQRGWYSPKIIEESQLQQAKNQFSSIRGRLQQQSQQWQQQGWRSNQPDWQQPHAAPIGQQQHNFSGWQANQQQYQPWNTPRQQGAQAATHNPT